MILDLPEINVMVFENLIEQNLVFIKFNYTIKQVECFWTKAGMIDKLYPLLRYAHLENIMQQLLTPGKSWKHNEINFSSTFNMDELCSLAACCKGVNELQDSKVVFQFLYQHGYLTNDSTESLKIPNNEIKEHIIETTIHLFPCTQRQRNFLGEPKNKDHVLCF